MSISSEARRTLVKSPPELWSEVSDAESLARHLGDLQDIRITRAEPESAVEWEATGASGSVRLEPSGFGTKVTLALTREVEGQERPAVEIEPEAVQPEPEPQADEPGPQADEPGPQADEPGPQAIEPEPVIVEEPPVKVRWFARLFKRRAAEPQAAIEPQSVPEPLPEPEPEPQPVAIAEPEPVLEPEPGPEPVAVAEPMTVAEPEPVATPEPRPSTDVTADLAALEAQMAEQDEQLLTAMLDRLGAAHHRPFSRA